MVPEEDAVEEEDWEEAEDDGDDDIDVQPMFGPEWQP